MIVVLKGEEREFEVDVGALTRVMRILDANWSVGVLVRALAAVDTDLT